MIEEKNFNDVRRNYILASIIFILFLIYWWKDFEINKILLFDLSWEWSLISDFWDFFILIWIFFSYTFIRYLIYGFESIKNNNYQHLVLFLILEKILTKWWKNFEKNNLIISWNYWNYFIKRNIL